MPDPLQTTFDVIVGDATYTFRAPTIKYDIEVGYRASQVRAKAVPEGGGALGGLDYATVQFARYCAIIELYLVKATTLWPYGFATDDMGQVNFDNPPKVDFEKFPADRTDDVYTVGDAFEKEVTRFRRRGDPDRAPAGA